jgi:hypothetical protein
VSLPWSKPATIALAPEGIALRASGSDSARLLKTLDRPMAWEFLLLELRGMARELDLKRVRFVLSSQFVRYAVLPAQTGIVSGRDWQALSEHHLRKLYGAVADHWEVRVALQGHAEPAVACAVDRALIAALEDVAQAARWQLHGIEPALMAVFNQHRRVLPASHWLLLAEPQRLLLAEVADGIWQRFSVALPPAGEEKQAALQMLERAMQHGDGRVPPQLACFGESALLPAVAPSGMRLLRLPQPASLASPLLLAGL